MSEPTTLQSVRTPARYLVGLDEDEMVCRLLEGFLGLKRPPGATAAEALKTIDDENLMAARRAVRKIMDYWRERIQALQPSTSDGSVTLPVCQWQPIETAPKDGTWVLGFRPTSFREDQIDTWQFVHRSCDPPIWINSADSNDEDEQPTHWMPLPLPPDDRTNGSEAQSGSLNQALPASSVSATDAVEAERRLREALAPLAAFATFMDKDAPDEAYLPATVPHISLTLGQARAAATLLGFPHASDDPQFNGERLAAIRSRGTDGGTNG